MAKKIKPDNAPKRTPANEKLLAFLKVEKIVLILDEFTEIQRKADGMLYTANKIPRLQIYYEDQVKKEKDKPKVDIAN